jgi:hypothetical protein
MKTAVYCSLFVVLTFLLPATSDAFSRRSKGSDFAPTQALTTPVTTTTTDAQAVPEPPVLLLMTIGLGVFAVGAAVKAVRRRS